VDQEGFQGKGFVIYYLTKGVGSPKIKILLHQINALHHFLAFITADLTTNDCLSLNTTSSIKWLFDTFKRQADEKVKNVTCWKYAK